MYRKDMNGNRLNKKNSAIAEFFCGASWIRTSDTRIFSPLLYQLSYGTLFYRSVTELAMQIYRPFSNSKTFAGIIFEVLFKVLILIEIKLHQINIGNGQITVSLHFNKIL